MSAVLQSDESSEVEDGWTELEGVGEDVAGIALEGVEVTAGAKFTLSFPAVGLGAIAAFGVVGVEFETWVPGSASPDVIA